MLRLRHKVYHLIAQQVGLARRYPHPVTHTLFMRLQCVQTTQQINELLPCTPPEIAYVHPRQHYFFRPLVYCLLCRFHHLRDARIARFAACQRNSAVGTKVVAPVLHFQETPCPVVSGIRSVKVIHRPYVCRKLWGDYGLFGGRRGSRRPAPLYLLHQLGNLKLRVLP